MRELWAKQILRRPIVGNIKGEAVVGLQTIALISADSTAPYGGSVTYPLLPHLKQSYK
jgi:hypothetical protein